MSFKENLNLMSNFNDIKISCQLYFFTLVKSDPKAPFEKLPHQGIEEGATPFLGLLHFTLDPYLIMLSAKQGSIKYHFSSLWYDSTWD